MEPTVVLVLLGLAAAAAVIARGRPAEPQREPVPVRVDEQPHSIVRR